MTRDELGTVDELREVGPRGAHDRWRGDRPALRVDFTANLVVHQLHLFAALQRLEKQNVLTPAPIHLLVSRRTLEVIDGEILPP